MRRKSDFTSALDQMFCEDDKKRIVAIRLVKQIGTAIGPVRTRNELVPFLNQFLDDDPTVMLTLLEELQNFTPILGGSEHDKVLLPLLINFCLLDEKEVAMKALALIEQILIKNNDAFLDTVKKLVKAQMTVAKQCAAILMANGVKKVPHLETTFLETYKSLVFSENPSIRIIAAKHLKKLTENASNKEQICKIIDVFFNDPEDLPKLLVIDSLLVIYGSNPTAVLNKLKSLICMGTWRINLRLCEFADEFSKYLSKIHFKTLLEPTFLKMMGSEDNEIRSASCSALVALAKNMSPQENHSKLYPIILKLSQDKVDFVRNEFAAQFVKIFPFFSPEKVRECLIPIVIKCLKESNLEVSAGVLTDFKELSKHIKADKFEENILKPLANQLSAQNWRLCAQTLDILGTIVIEQSVYTNFMTETLLKELKNRVEAVRLKASQIIIGVIKNSPRDWCESQFLPVLMKSKDEPNYLIRQRIIAIINETSESVSAVWLANYRKIMSEMLADKTPNIRMLALKSVYSNRKLLDKGCESLLYKLKEDNDMEIKQAVREIKI